MADDNEMAKELIRLLSLPSADWPHFEIMPQPVSVTMGPSAGASPNEWASFAAGMKADQKSMDNDLQLQLERVRYSLEQIFKHHAAHFEWPDAPMRVAILLRKSGKASLEADFLEGLTTRLPSGLGARFQKLKQRAEQARKLGEKG